MAIANRIEKIEHIRFSEIYADYTWNIRKADVRSEGENPRPIITVGVGGDSDPSRGRDGLVASIATHGQETPCVVRKSPAGAKHKKPYELVCGFRRHDARLQVAEDKKEENPTLACTIRTLTDKEARAMNVRENTERDGLGGGDLVYAVAKTVELDKNISQKDLSDTLGISPGYANILYRVHVGVSPKIIGEWRAMPNPPKAAVLIDKLVTGGGTEAIAKNSREQHEAWDKLKAGKVKSTTPSRGKDGWMAKCETEARRLGLAIGRMSRDGHLTLHGEAFWYANARALLGGIDGPMKDKATDEQVDHMVEVLENAAAEGEQASQSEADVKACELNGLTPKVAPKAPESAPAKKKKKGNASPVPN